MKKLLLNLLILFLIASCQQKSPKPRLTFDQVLENYHQESLALYRITATFLGDSRYNDTLPNFLAADFKAKEKAFYTQYQNTMNSFEDTTLTEEQLLSKKILLWECTQYLEGMAFKKELMPIDQMWGFQLLFGQLASGASAQPFVTVKDYENWLVRLEGYLEWMQSAEDNMRIGITEGMVLPQSLIIKVLPQLEALTTTNLDSHLFYQPIKNLPQTFEEGDKKRLTEAYSKIILERIIPAYLQLHDFMANDYYAAGRSSSGYIALPDGKAYYDYAIKLYTTTTLSADSIHQLGLSEVARIENEMKKVMQQVHFKGSLKAFFDHVRNLDELKPFKTPKEVIENFYAIRDKMLPQVNKLFDLQPKTPFEVRRTEAFREASASAEYNAGSLDGTRPGIFYVPIPDIENYSVVRDEDLFLHEAIPGHHFQISLQLENESLPSFRKNLGYSAYSEGWALYTESLGKELGLYDDPYQYFGMLGAEMHRAIRLVVDTGLHSKGWTREEAIDYSLAHEARSEASIIAEVERYMANPGQALSYKIGQLKILELRKRAEEHLGEAFDIRMFHRIVLGSGPMPLYLLENLIDQWIASSKNS